eukprot:9760631-Ditylum_brightwellii.AAC.1
MDAAKYATKTGGVAYVASPQHPGMYDTNIAANSDHVMQSWHKAEHKQLIEDHMIEKAVFQVCKNQLQEALSKWLLSEIEDCDTGLNTVSLQDIFDHAYDGRGQIDNDLVDEYTNNFNTPIDMTQGINTYAECQEECRDFFSDAQQPITDQQLAGKGQLHVGQTGIFQEKYLTWKRHPIANKAWSDFKMFWNREFSDYKTLNQISTKDAGFGANAIVQGFKAAYHNLEEAMDNLVYAATTSNNVVEELVNTNSKLVEQLKA